MVEGTIVAIDGSENLASNSSTCTDSVGAARFFDPSMFDATDGVA